MKYIGLCVCMFFCVTCTKQTSEELYSGVTVADKNASSATTNFYGNLFRLMEKGIMLGHQDDLIYGNQWYGEAGRSDVQSVCGEYPAVFGWNVGKVETGASYNVDSVSFDYIKENIKRAHHMGGISTITWHADNPATASGVGDCSGSSVIESVLPGNENHEKYLSYLDRLAAFFQDLKDESGEMIPVIFRLFDGGNVRKYWWNAEQASPEIYKQVWRMTVDYLREEKKINHLLYAYSMFNVKDMEEFVRYYPGNDFVDIVGTEVYFSLEEDPDGEMFKSDLERNLVIISTFAKKHGKIPALTETGLQGIKIFNFFSDYVYPLITKYPVSYMLFWRNAWDDEAHYYIPIPGHPACEDFVSFVRKPEIITLRNPDKKEPVHISYDITGKRDWYSEVLSDF